MIGRTLQFSCLLLQTDLDLLGIFLKFSQNLSFFNKFCHFYVSNDFSDDLTPKMKLENLHFQLLFVDDFHLKNPQLCEKYFSLLAIEGFLIENFRSQTSENQVWNLESQPFLQKAHPQALHTSHGGMTKGRTTWSLIIFPSL